MEYCRGLGIRHILSSAYNPASNGAAERGVGQIKGLLEKIGRRSVLSQDDLNRLVFKLNSNMTAGQGSALQRFFGRNVGTYQPEFMRKQLDHAALIAKIYEVQMKVAEKLGRRSTDEFKLGDQVLAQNMKTLKWTIRGQVVDCRTADDGSTRSFVIKTDTGRTTPRNSRHLKFQAMKKNVTFADDDSNSDDGAVLNTRINDTATNEARVTDRAEKRVSAILAALAAARL